MDLATLALLLTPTGAAALAAATELAPSEAKYPAHFDRLRKHFPAELARAALDTVMLRAKARAKFTRADAMFFTREALEMATAEPVARYRAERFRDWKCVADLCCGFGSDAIALASAGHEVVAVESNPLLAKMTEANLASHGLAARVRCEDALTVELPDAEAAFADPGRRRGGRRTLSLHECEPPVLALAARFPDRFPLAVKVAPGIPRDEIADSNAEFISLHGELKECVLGFGPLRGAETRAVVLPGPHILSGTPDTYGEAGDMGMYLYEPDAAVTRSALVGVLATQLRAKQIDPGISLLTSNQRMVTPFASVYRVEEVLQYQPKRIGEWLKAHGVGRVTLVKRGSLLDAEELLRKWKLRGDEHRDVILTRALGQPVAVIATRLRS